MYEYSGSDLLVRVVQFVLCAVLIHKYERRLTEEMRILGLDVQRVARVRSHIGVAHAHPLQNSGVWRRRLGHVRVEHSAREAGREVVHVEQTHLRQVYESVSLPSVSRLLRARILSTYCTVDRTGMLDSFCVS